MDAIDLSPPRGSTNPSQLDEPHRIHRVRAVPGTPVEMRAGDAPRRANDAYLLTALHCVTSGDARFRQMEVARHHARTVIHVDHIAREKEIGDDRNDSAVCRTHGIARLPREIDTPMAARYPTIE